jgi:hypothetical protein
MPLARQNINAEVLCTLLQPLPSLPTQTPRENSRLVGGTRFGAEIFGSRFAGKSCAAEWSGAEVILSVRFDGW